MNRRQFLPALGLLAAGAMTRAADKPRLRIGFLGASHSHAAPKIRLCRNHPDFELIGICEPSEKIRASLLTQQIEFLPEAELIQRAEVVAVESDVRDHFRHARAVLRAGRHLHVEKPPAVTLGELKQLVRLARDKQLLFQAGYMWRYHPGFELMFKAVREGWLGEVTMVRGHMGNQIDPARRGEWAEFGGGSFFELACHLIDPVVRLLGRPKSIKPILRTHGSASDSLKDNNAVTLEFPRALAVITNTSLQADPFPQRSFESIGSLGGMVLKPIEPPVLQLTLTRPAGGFTKGAHTIPLPKYERYVADFQRLAAAIRGETPLPATLEEELLVHEVLLRACAMRLG